MNKALNKQRVDAAAERLSAVMRTIELQNDFINLSSDVSDSKGAQRVRAAILDKGLTNIFELNQMLMNDLDDAACLLYDISNELQDMQKAE